TPRPGCDRRPRPRDCHRRLSAPRDRSSLRLCRRHRRTRPPRQFRRSGLRGVAPFRTAWASAMPRTSRRTHRWRRCRSCPCRRRDRWRWCRWTRSCMLLQVRPRYYLLWVNVPQMNPEIFETRDDEPDQCFPAGVAQSIAVAIGRLVDVEPGDLFLEVGAGTGEMGIELSRIMPRYRGFDRSASRLGRFRQRIRTKGEVPGFDYEPAGAIEIVQADAEEMWPAPSGGVRATFGSRVFHLLSTDHLVREVFRVS